MLKHVLLVFLATVVGGVGLSACDTAEPPEVAADLTESGTSMAEASVGEAPEEVGVSGADERAADEFRQSLAKIVRDRDAFLLAEKLAVLLRTSGPEGVPAAVEALENNALDLGAAGRELLVRYWATHQPEIATNWTLKSTLVHRLPAVACALSIWAQADPEAAVAAADVWMAKDPHLVQSLPVALIRGWYANGDSPELQQYIQGFGKSFARQRAIATYLRAMIQAHGGQHAERWAESLSDDDDPAYKLDVYRQVAVVLPLFDLDAGIGWCKKHCDGPFGSGLRGMIGRQWVKRDGPSAIAWLLTAAESRDNNLALRGSYAVWGRWDREAALRWMRERATATELDPRLGPMIPVYVVLATPDSPKDTIEFAMRIEDEIVRATALVLIVREWRKTDPDASEAWLVQSPLSETDRARARRDGNNLRVPQEAPAPDEIEP